MVESNEPTTIITGVDLVLETLQAWLEDSKARYASAPTPEARAAELRCWQVQWVVIKKNWRKEGRDLADFTGLTPPEDGISEIEQAPRSRAASGED